MISLCTVLIKGPTTEYLSTLVESVEKKTTLISEIIAVQIDTQEKYDYTEGIVRRIGHSADHVYGHAIGLHKGIDIAKNEYILMCDPDIFFYIPIDEFYLNLIEKYKLNAVGVSHHAAVNQCYTFFPCVMNLMVKKNDLPDENFLKGRLKLRPSILNLEVVDPKNAGEENLKEAPGKYLLGGPIKELIKEFPNKDPRCNYDVGSNLYIWAKRQNWRWLSFQTTDCHKYTTKYFRNNIKLREKLPVHDILYHATSSALNRQDSKEIFMSNYKETEKKNISLVVATLEQTEIWMPIFLDSIYKNLSKIKEIIEVRVDRQPFYKEEYYNEIVHKTIGCMHQPREKHNSAFHIGTEHALGLHEGINLAQYEYILISDPDLFFYPGADEIYLNLMNEYNLNIIGASHHIAVKQAHKFFPHVINYLVRKADLPNESFLQEYLTPEYIFKESADTIRPCDLEKNFKGKYLVPTKITELAHLYAKTEDSHNETGGNLYLWAQQQNWNWLAFQTTDCHLYTTQYNRGNIKLSKKLENKKIIYHAVDGTNHNHYNELKDLYNQEFGENL